MVTRNPKCRVGSEEEKKTANSICSRMSKWELAQELQVPGDLTRKCLEKRGRVINTSSSTEGSTGKATTA